MAIIKMMVGIPASGKSTYAKEHKGKNDIYISRDEVRYSLLGELDDYFSKETLVYNKFVDLVNRAMQIENIENIWVDATHLDQASRMKLIRRLLPKYTSLEAVVIDTPRHICITRNDNRTGRTKVPAASINRMADKFTIPTVREGFDKIVIVDYYGEETIYTK